MTNWQKIIGFMVSVVALVATLPLAYAAVGNIDDTPGVERVFVGPDGSLHAWNKEWAVLADWPKTSVNRHFIPRKLGPFGAGLVLISRDKTREQAPELLMDIRTASGRAAITST